MAEPIERRNLASLVSDMERWGSGRAIVEHRGVRRFPTDYRTLAHLARRFASELDRRGIAPGERVLLWGANSAEWVAAFFGCVLRGVLVVPLEATGSIDFAQRVAQETTPRLVVGDADLIRHLPTPHLALRDLPRLLPAHRAVTPPDLNPETPLQILFTSGTTGEPKGVVHTHGNLLASLGPIEREIEKYRSYERPFHPLRFLHTLPLSHVFGQFMGLWLPPLLGATVHYEQRATASRLSTLIAREHINVLAAVPRTLDLLRAHLLQQFPYLAQQIQQAQGEKAPQRWWRFRHAHWRLGLRFWAIVCGGATLPEDLEQFWATLGFALIQGYGLTETAALVTLNHPFKTSRGSVGAPLPGRELRLAPNGELEVRGAMVATGSWQSGAITQREDPWLATGDIATLAEDGRVRFLGRSGQRLVTAAGLNIYLQDIEQALEHEPELQAAVVFGLPGGEQPAVVVLAHGGNAAAQNAISRANAQLAPHQRVRRWWVWPALELPRTATGKVRRKAVEDWALARLSDDDATGSSSDVPLDPATLLLEQVGRRGGPQQDTARLDEDWGLDSMGRVALASALEEQLGVPLDDMATARLQTYGDLRNLLRSTPADAASQPQPRSRDRTTATAYPPTGLHKRPGLPVQTAGARHNVPRRRPQTIYRYPAWPWSAPIRALRLAFTELLVRPLVALLANPRTRIAASPLPSGPMLLVSNHRTAMDLPLILFALPFHVRRSLAVAMSGEMLMGMQQSWSRAPLPPELDLHRRWWGPPAALLLKALFNVFPLPRTVGFRESFAHAGRALDRGFHVLIFPEGRRIQAPALEPFKPGLGILAQEAYAPLLPIALSLASADRRGWFRTRPGSSIGTPVQVDSSASVEDTTRRAEAQVAALLAESRPLPNAQRL